MTISQVGNGLLLPVLEQLSRPTTAHVDVAQPSSPGSQPEASAAVSPEQFQQAMKQVAEAVQAKASNLEFSVDQDTGKIVAKVVDAQTHEVIRQIPPQEMLDIAKAIERAQGLLLRQKA